MDGNNDAGNGGMTDFFFLMAGENNPTIDAGYKEKEGGNGGTCTDATAMGSSGKITINNINFKINWLTGNFCILVIVREFKIEY